MGFPSYLEAIIERASTFLEGNACIGEATRGVTFQMASKSFARSTPSEQMREIRERQTRPFIPLPVSEEQHETRPVEVAPKLPKAEVKRYYRMLARESDRLLQTLEDGRTKKGWQDALELAIDLLRDGHERRVALKKVFRVQSEVYLPRRRGRRTVLQVPTHRLVPPANFPEGARERFDEIRRIRRVLREITEAISESLLLIESYRQKLSGLSETDRLEYQAEEDHANASEKCAYLVSILSWNLKEYLFDEPAFERFLDEAMYHGGL